MIELFISMAALAAASYAVWISSGVTSCQRELKSLERRVNGFRDDMLEWLNRTNSLEDKAKEFARWDQDIRRNIREMDRLHSNWIKSLTDRVNEQHESTQKVAKLIDTMTQEIRGELSITDVSVEELKIQIIKCQAEQQRMQSAMKENRDALVKWFEGEL
jgi:uncharacterized protein YoxC